MKRYGAGKPVILIFHAIALPIVFIVVIVAAMLLRVLWHERNEHDPTY